MLYAQNKKLWIKPFPWPRCKKPKVFLWYNDVYNSFFILVTEMSMKEIVLLDFSLQVNWGTSFHDLNFQTWQKCRQHTSNNTLVKNVRDTFITIYGHSPLKKNWSQWRHCRYTINLFIISTIKKKTIWLNRKPKQLFEMLLKHAFSFLIFMENQISTKINRLIQGYICEQWHNDWISNNAINKFHSRRISLQIEKESLAVYSLIVNCLTLIMLWKVEG